MKPQRFPPSPNKNVKAGQKTTSNEPHVDFKEIKAVYKHEDPFKDIPA